jgi:iron complex outermembrane recepter protein
MFRCQAQFGRHFSQVRETCEIFGLVVAAAQALVLLAIAPIGRAQTANPANPPLDQPAAANTAPGINPNQGAEPTAGGQLPSVVVTGYLVPHVGAGPQPVTSYDQTYITKTGDQQVADVLQSLPAATGNVNPGFIPGFGFQPGAASIALKGKLPNDTLVLVDGLRMPAYPFFEFTTTSGPFLFTDINSIPLGAIDRVDILNDGGSATYGTDAVAGVVNFITKYQYNGADIYNYYGISQRDDYEVYHGEFTGGIVQQLGQDSKISVLGVFDYYDQSPVEAIDRSKEALNYSRYSFKYPNAPVFPGLTGQFTGLTTGNFYQPKPGFNGVNPTPSDFIINGAPLESFSIQGLQVYPREQRIGGLVKIDYEPTSWLKLYDSFLVNRTEEVSTFGPNQGTYGGGFSGNAFLVVPANNPYNPFGEPLRVGPQAFNEFGVLRTDTVVTTFREVIGATIRLPHDWYIDTNWLYGESDGTETLHNFFKFTGLQQALDGTLPGNEGDFFNPFADESVAGPNRVFYGNRQLIDSIFEDIRSDIMQFHTVAGGTLWELPSGPINVAGGFEYRSEDFIINDDPYSHSGNLTAPQFPIGALTNARRYIWSIFGELDIPIVGGAWSSPGLRSIEVTMSERQDYYSDFGSAAKPKIAILYKPFNDLTLRGTYSESFVAPSLTALFTSPQIGETPLVDPKNPSAGQELVLTTITGNPRLKPENAYTYYVGGVWSPGSSDPEHSWWGWANGFSAYVNWFQIDQHNQFGTLSGQEVVNLGAAAPPGNFVTRNPTTGQLLEVTTAVANLGNGRTEGIEFGFTYNSKEYNWGKIDLQFDSSYLYWLTQQTLVGVNPNGTPFYRVFNLTDTAIQAASAPDLKFLASAFYSKTVFGIDTFKTGLTLHYIGSEQDFTNSANGTNPNATLNFPNYVHLIGSWTTLDWQISYRFGEPTEITPQAPKPGYDKEGKKIVGEKAIAPAPEGSRWGWRNLLANTTFTFGINNIFDTAAPFAVDAAISNFDAGSGVNNIRRYFWVSVDKKF